MAMTPTIAGFSADEIGQMVVMVAGESPEKYESMEAKAIIFKCRAFVEKAMAEKKRRTRS